jgi:putative transposase
MLAFMNIAHERIHSATPADDAHIESFSAILEKEVMRSFEFNSFTHAEQTISRFINFYNNERLYSGVGYCATRQAYLNWKGISGGGLQ